MEVTERFASRAILLTPQEEILLMKFQNPDTQYEFWITPGGGIEQNENPAISLKRELYEELGLENISIGPLVWNRTHEFEWEGRFLKQSEVFYLVRTEIFDPTNENMILGPETRAFRNFKWWTVSEIELSNEVFAPRDMGIQLRNILTKGVPTEPMIVGV